MISVWEHESCILSKYPVEIVVGLWEGPWSDLAASQVAGTGGPRCPLPASFQQFESVSKQSIFYCSSSTFFFIRITNELQSDMQNCLLPVGLMTVQSRHFLRYAGAGCIAVPCTATVRQPTK
jgi:hypothetical protein